MNDQQDKYSLEDLASEVEIPTRTIRFYIAEGLLPGPGARGKAATYDEEHLLRLRLIRRLADRRVPLAEIREQMGQLSVDQVRSLLAEEDARVARMRRGAESLSPRDYVAALLARAQHRRPSETGEPVSASMASDYDQRQGALVRGPHARVSHRQATPEVWEHWVLTPGVELHVRSDVVSEQRTLIERILRMVGRLPAK